LQNTMVPDELLLLFFKRATSALLDLKGSEVIKDAHEYEKIDPQASSRQCVLNVQQSMLQNTLEIYQAETLGAEDDIITIPQIRERLGNLKDEPQLSPDLQKAVDGMNEAARLACCKLVLYFELWLAGADDSIQQRRCLQDCTVGAGLDRTRLLEYFGLCQAALKLHCVKKFMAEGGSLFDGLVSPSSLTNASMEDSKLLFPQSRLEFVQQLLAKSMGWDPVLLSRELQRIFVEQEIALPLVHDQEVSHVFQELVQQMTLAIRIASLQMKDVQQAQLLSDLEKGGSTRVVSVQYSEFDVTHDGRKVVEGRTAPGALTMEAQLSEEEQKKQIRLSNEAAILQQEILGELLSLQEHERKNRLDEAERVNDAFTREVMTLPPGRQRIDFLRGVDPQTSRLLAMHKLWKAMLDANGGNPPKIAECQH
jgi:hypothetical protein